MTICSSLNGAGAGNDLKAALPDLIPRYVDYGIQWMEATIRRFIRLRHPLYRFDYLIGLNGVHVHERSIPNQPNDDGVDTLAIMDRKPLFSNVAVSRRTFSRSGFSFKMTIIVFPPFSHFGFLVLYLFTCKKERAETKRIFKRLAYSPFPLDKWRGRRYTEARIGNVCSIWGSFTVFFVHCYFKGEQK